jgi:FKBP-type peptidyl-prolyl cis-trans isomerase FklB
MKTGLKTILAGVMVTLAAPAIFAADPKPADAKSDLKEGKEKVSYAIGMNVGSNLKRAGYDIDISLLAEGIKDSLAGSDMKLTEAQAREALTGYQKELSAKREEERKKTAEKNKKAGEAFLAENKKKPGIRTFTVTARDGTQAEIQYKVLAEGSGASPKPTDTVTVNYRGTTIDGKEFDSSAKSGHPGRFVLNQVVQGWTEALQKMKVGSKWELFLPSSVGYGDMGHGPAIEPGAALIFEIELVGIETPQPLTSDIIRVPSAEELKAGAKVEVIKPEDVEKAKAEAAKQSQKTNK